MKLNARQLRTTEPDPAEVTKLRKNPIYLILDNVLDTYNVGSVFRLADAVAAEKVYLCGDTLTPPNPRIKKASIDTWKWVKWQWAPSAKVALEQLTINNQQLTIIAVEQDPRSKPFYKVRYEFPIAIVVGNETTGVSKEVLDIADSIVELPMWGVNRSLNVMVSLGIVLYEIMKQNDASAHR
jgi:tRNA G18 (ribose-2'-O)-methylase SpoU